VSLVVCALMTLLVLLYVFYLPGKLRLGAEKTRLSFLQERKETVYENLRDLNFDFRAGKLPEADFKTMERSLEDEAAGILAEIASLERFEEQRS
jgi:hypothetical protein